MNPSEVKFEKSANSVILEPVATLTRNLDATISSMTTGVKTVNDGDTPVALAAAEIKGNYATFVSAAFNTNGSVLNTAVVLAGDSTLVNTGGCQGFQILPNDPKGFTIPLPAHKIYLVAADGSSTQKVAFAALVR